ncbi:MAG: CPBP family intramembrane glutamic endopeptidase [Candidatus Limivivens sp.]|nr:CPBP family intramembrane glutamic endopeptidase [Candidatus Limivivens sp.]
MNKTRSVNRLFLVMILWVSVLAQVLVRVDVTMTIWENMVASEVIFLIPVSIFLLRKREPLTEWVPVKPISVSVLLMTALFTVLLMPLITFLNAFSMLFAENYVAGESAELQKAGFWLNLLVVAVIPAVCEEFIFRGVFYSGYRENGILKAALTCGLVFGLMHRNVNQFFYASVLGVLFCFLVEATGSIFSSIAAHFLINGWNVFLVTIQKSLLGYLEKMEGAAYAKSVQTALSQEELVNLVCVYGVMAAVSTALAVCVLVWIANHCGRMAWMKENLHGREKERQGWHRILTPSLTGAAGICIGYMIMQELL